MRNGVTVRTGILLACVLALTGCTAMLLGGGNSDGTGSGGGVRTEAQVSSDRAVATAVRDRLVKDPALGRYHLRVESFRNKVILSGTVGSYALRERAIRLAGTVEGVERVDSRIQVVEGT
ncbi:MAG: BON domain-containing protein [Woeseia sp.]